MMNKSFWSFVESYFLYILIFTQIWYIQITAFDFILFHLQLWNSSWITADIWLDILRLIVYIEISFGSDLLDGTCTLLSDRFRFILTILSVIRSHFEAVVSISWIFAFWLRSWIDNLLELAIIFEIQKISLIFNRIFKDFLLIFLDDIVITFNEILINW